MRHLVVLVHGWGFDSTFWNGMREHLEGCDVTTFDLGFRGQPQTPELPSGRPILVVGHSLGVLWLLHERPFAWDRLVAINGFTRFPPSRAFDRMRARMEREPERAVADFMALCGVEAPAAIDIPTLKRGLEWLHTWDMQGQSADLALASLDDPIVPVRAAEGCWGPSRLIWKETGGHLLPLTAPEWCASRILELMEKP